MENDNQVTQILGDISVLRQQVRQSPEGNTPEIVLVYLLANHNLIEFYLNQAYQKFSKAQRLELCNSHSELDTSAVGDEFRSIAGLALELANDYYFSAISRPIDEDCLNMLGRGIAFAQYAFEFSIGTKLLMHPVQNYLPLKKESNEFFT